MEYTDEVKLLMDKAFDGDIDSIYLLKLNHPESHKELSVIESRYAKEIDNSIDIESKSFEAIYSLRDYFRGVEDLDGEPDLVMYFDGVPVLPVKISGEVFFTDEQMEIIDRSVSPSEKEKYCSKVYYGNLGNYVYIPSYEGYSKYLGGFKEFEGLFSSSLPEFILKGALAPIIRAIHMEEDIPDEEYSFSGISFVKVPNNPNKIDYLVCARKSMVAFSDLVKNNRTVIVSGVSFVDKDGESVIIRERSGEGIFDRVKIALL